MYTCLIRRRVPTASCAVAPYSVHFAILVACALSGCGRSDRGYVHGTVTLDGQPLPEATIEFQPASGSPSYGETDAAGQYELALSPTDPGAVPGNHTIRVSTFRVVPKEDGTREEIPERVPMRYNSETILTREVAPGRQTIDIEMSSENVSENQ
ncbi:MAG: carboxypeptidase regulatory-like domain-containing protein [Planctomycetaceae bacterium]|nr:carboxypeptidase regulatory-like domain-containing protein [Planctomycetaceae bacterium]MCB9937565.1 carboxypeptidase regulatory-like domain-containing protein [Planctomycetaceae bacterium]